MSTKNIVKKNLTTMAAIVIRATQIGCSAAAALWTAEKVTEKTQSMTVGTATGAAAGVAAYHLYDMAVENATDGINAIGNKIKEAKAKASAAQAPAPAPTPTAQPTPPAADSSATDDEDEWED